MGSGKCFTNQNGQFTLRDGRATASDIGGRQGSLEKRKMGIYERDYIKTPTRGGVGRLPMWSVTTWLIIINILVFAADWLIKAQWAAVHQVSVRAVTEQVMGPLELNGYFSIERAFQHGQAWRLLTCQFLHAGFWHLAMNMLGLWIFGELVERRIGRRRYAFFYLLCGIAGPFMYTALWTLGYLTPIGFMPHANTPLVGASAGIFGVMLAAAYLEPDRLIYVYFIEVPLKYFAWFMVAVAAYTVFAHGENAGGQAAHLGGALLGYILIRHDSALNLVVRRNRSQRVFTKDWSRDPNR
jgi:membrane associated rhomboid family serine protease